jgi:hypothetical protein
MGEQRVFAVASPYAEAEAEADEVPNLPRSRDVIA